VSPSFFPTKLLTLDSVHTSFIILLSQAGGGKKIKCITFGWKNRGKIHPSLQLHNFFFLVALQSLKDLDRLTYRRFLELFRHMIGFRGRVIIPSQGLYLHRTTQHRKTRAKHPCLKRDSNPRSQQPTSQDPRLRLHGHCDRHSCIILKWNPVK
jgi:hypothetical protein